jgi:hypothetical protein
VANVDGDGEEDSDDEMRWRERGRRRYITDERCSKRDKRMHRKIGIPAPVGYITYAMGNKKKKIHSDITMSLFDLGERGQKKTSRRSWREAGAAVTASSHAHPGPLPRISDRPRI